MAEFRALQAQINPHFLYNSLDSINWLVRKGDMEKATDTISALTAFFRIGLSKGRDMITVREEVEHVRSYLVIQKMRYENQFEYAFYVDPETEDYFVPKLMLQPLVENALYHGIKLCDRKCMLMISPTATESRWRCWTMAPAWTRRHWRVSGRPWSTGERTGLTATVS